MKNIDYLRVSEQFLSIQGEGKTMGVPSIFLRLQSCNLLCQWPCDTIGVWRKGTKYTTDEIIQDWYQRGWLDKLRNGTHLILTGGEPMLQQEGLANLLRELPPCYKEVETNATIEPKNIFDKYINQYNCSPKTSNSGMNERKRFKEDVIKWFTNDGRSVFKFVVDTPNDMKEILDDFVYKFQIKPSKVYLMPEAISEEELRTKRIWVAELCKEHGFNYSDRLQLLIWGKATGV